MYGVRARQTNYRGSDGTIRKSTVDPLNVLPSLPNHPMDQNFMRPVPIFSAIPENYGNDNSSFPMVTNENTAVPIGTINVPISPNRAYQREMGISPYVIKANKEPPISSPYSGLSAQDRANWMITMKEIHANPNLNSREKEMYANQAIAEYMPYYANRGGMIRSAQINDLFK